jgi:serine protease Do
LNHDYQFWKIPRQEIKMQAKLFRPFIWLAVFIIIVGLACSTGGSSSQEPGLQTESPATKEAQPAATEPPAEATSPPTQETPSGAASNLQDVKNAVVQIEAQGTFVNPDFTVSYNAAGLGSGFIIDPSGIAITNNHVVTGAGLLKVWVGGDRTKTHNAKVLGVSECSDLAVIDLEGDGFSYLDWHTGPIDVGLEVYAAGFPLGEPEFTLTKGIVSKEQAGGETSWASVDYVVEHDATINPGNSGGPLVDEKGGVVGINYRGRTTDQYFAIGRDLAMGMVDKLRNGQDVNTFGVNGEAFANEDFSGIWVYSVKSGSPADKAGLEGGDIITTLEDLVLATDGTMADYCDILRSHNPEDALSIEILRYASGEVLQGQINGRALEPVYTFGQNVGGEVGDQQSSSGAMGYSGFVPVSDDYGAIQMNVPAEWADVDGSYWTDEGDTIGAAISAAADLDSFYNTWNESGVFFGASDDLAKLGGYVQLLDIRRDAYNQDCKLDGRYDYDDGYFRGKYDLFTNCAGQGTAFLVLSAVPVSDPQGMLILVEMQITQDADFDALDEILRSFDVVGVLP